MPLKKISRILSPDLLYVLASMGHGDEIVLADDNFPSSCICANGPKLVRADGHSMAPLLEAILQLLPLDTYTNHPVTVMDPTDEDKAKGLKTTIWETYSTLIASAEKKKIELYKMERDEFYEQAKRAFAVVHTGETALYGNIILTKGVIPA